MAFSFLINAYACEPDKGSEPGIGWNWALYLAKQGNNVVVITRSNNEEIIKQELKNPLYKDINLRFIFCDANKWVRKLKKGQKFIHLYYHFWQKEAYKIAKEECKKTKFDYCLAVTFGNIWLYNPFYKLPVKFIWGPLGGGEGISHKLLGKMGIKQFLYECFRNINKYIPITNIRLRKICKKSFLLIARTQDTFNVIPKKYRHKTKVMIETGISKQEIEYFNSLKIEKNDYFVFSGKLVDYKMPNLAIDSFIKAKNDGNIKEKLVIIGDGPNRKKLENRISKSIFQKEIVFTGNVERQKALEIMANSKGIILPSGREAGSWIIFEAMLLKKPIVCFNCTGMHEILYPNLAYFVNVDNYNNSMLKFSRHIINISKDFNENLVNEAYDKCIKEYLWENKMKMFMSYIYEYELEKKNK